MVAEVAGPVGRLRNLDLDAESATVVKSKASSAEIKQSKTFFQSVCLQDKGLHGVEVWVGALLEEEEGLQVPAVSKCAFISSTEPWHSRTIRVSIEGRKTNTVLLSDHELRIARVQLMTGRREQCSRGPLLLHLQLNNDTQYLLFFESLPGFENASGSRIRSAFDFLAH